MPLPLETARGFVNVWDCDEIGHYNVQFYVAKKTEADAHLRLALGLPPLNRAEDGLRVTIEQDHIRYHGELRAVDTFVLRSGVTALDEGTLTVLHELHNERTGALSATFVSRWACRDGASPAPRPWPAAVREAAAAFSAPLPDPARPRSLGRDARGAVPGLEAVRQAGLPATHRTLVHPGQCDAAGVLAPQHLTALFSESAAHLWHRFGLDWAELQTRNQGTVVLEHFIRHGAPAPAGSALEVLGYTGGRARKTLSFGALVFNAETGELAAMMEATAVVFDLAARKALPVPLEDPARFDALAWPFNT